MKVFIVYCHPSEDSFTRNVRDAFIKGIIDSGNEYVMSDLYKMNFKTDMSEKEYLRDSNYSTEPGLESDVLAEQAKINSADAIVFIYPVFWTEAPAKLVGWFDRVWSYGFAYGDKTMKVLDKALILCTAGKNLDDLENLGLLDCMKKVMLGDRLFNRVKERHVIPERQTGTSIWTLPTEKVTSYSRLFLNYPNSRSSENQHACMIGRVVTRINFC